MDNITLDKVTYTLKNSWNDFSINEYFDILELTQSTILSNDEKYANILAIALSKDFDFVDNMNLQHFKLLIQKLKFLQDGELEKIKIPDHIYINGKLFKIYLKLKDYSTEQYLNITHFLESKDEREKLINITANIIVPATKVNKFYGTKIEMLNKYNMDEHTEFIGNNISIVLANSIFLFFYQVLNSLTLSSITSSVNKMKRKMIQLKFKKMLRIAKQKELLGLNALIESVKGLEELGKKHLK